MGPVITTNSLTKKYKDKTVVSQLDLRIPGGSIYGFLGPNGAGKSTTLKMLLGLIRPTEGKIQILGKEVCSRNRLSILSDTGSLIESPAYYGHLTGKENLQIICTLKNVPEKDISRVLSIVRMEEQQNKKVSQYSLGMKQRLGLAAALLGKPKLLLLDQPTNGLDPARNPGNERTDLFPARDPGHYSSYFKPSSLRNRPNGISCRNYQPGSTDLSGQPFCSS